jgi:flagellar biosynthesis/type III secretory pathway protein FliH
MRSSREPTRFPVAAFAPPELRLVVEPVAAAPRVPAAPPTALEEAWQRGYDDGVASRDEHAERLRDDAVAALGAAIEGLSAVSREIRDRLGANLPALALAVARHLVQREIVADPTVMRDLIERALTLTPLSGPVTVRLHPADLDALGDVSAFGSPVESQLELKWVGDATVLRGGCTVETAASVVDGRVDQALLDLYERLRSE